MNKYLNIGCGNHVSDSPEWINVDFASNNPNVISHNLLNGIPFSANEFDLVYHSHVLEHFTKKDGIKLINECYRVLKPNGTIRIAIPNLEEIAKLYLENLNNCWNDPNNNLLVANYQWILLEMYDQTVRNQVGGELMNFLNKKNLVNKDYIIKRIGFEAEHIINSQENEIVKPNFVNTIKVFLRKLIYGHKRTEFLDLGQFRNSGEIHQWMYDRVSLRQLLLDSGFIDFKIVSATTSTITNWEHFNLDTTNGIIRKPDSLFVEARKF
jgi:predicted SAM-dependent methyltransferase